MIPTNFRHAKDAVNIRDSPTFDQFIEQYVQDRGYIHRFVLPERGMGFVLYEWYDPSVRDLILPDGRLNAKRRKDGAEAKIYLTDSQRGDYYIVTHPMATVGIREKRKMRNNHVYPYHVDHDKVFSAAQVKTICFRHDALGLILVSTLDDAEIDSKELGRSAFGLSGKQAKRISLCPQERLKEALGMDSGTVTPLVEVSYLDNVCAIIFDSKIERSTQEKGRKLEVPLPQAGYNPRYDFNYNVFTEHALVYDPATHSLGRILSSLYGEKFKTLDVPVHA
ncbi:MAG: hypothetical protein HYW24_04370 [Candidatus Aenigmarchaeota archaeon]|nr:hypothetical protein [Candidatus Aenigmarchaeota archaeon]